MAEEPKEVKNDQEQEVKNNHEKTAPLTSTVPDVEPVPRLPVDDERVRPQTVPLSAPWRLLLQIGEENPTTVGIEVRDRILLGRGDPLASFYPDLDLTPYGGQTGGVSRHHATIMQDDESKALYLEDLNSTNGTRINGFALEPKRRYRLRDGDELEFGRLRVVVRFVRTPYK